jgi:hypothetical protein
MMRGMEQNRPGDFYYFTRGVLQDNQDHTEKPVRGRRDKKSRLFASSFHIHQQNLELLQIFQECGVELVR